MSNLRFLAIDETDRMIEKGHFEELEKILKLIKRYKFNSRFLGKQEFRRTDFGSRLLAAEGEGQGGQ
jgi:ATP-dependent RNA helicase DDX24/MAK5